MKKYFPVAGVIAGTILIIAMAPAMAGGVDVDVNIGLPGVIHQAPVYVQPHQVYVQPHEVYVQPHEVYVQPHEVYVEPHQGYVRRYGEHERSERHGRARQWQERNHRDGGQDQHQHH